MSKRKVSVEDKIYAVNLYLDGTMQICVDAENSIEL